MANAKQNNQSKYKQHSTSIFQTGILFTQIQIILRKSELGSINFQVILLL